MLKPLSVLFALNRAQIPLYSRGLAVNSLEFILPIFFLYISKYGYVCMCIYTHTFVS